MKDRNHANVPRLMLVTDRNETRGRDLIEVVIAAVRGGVDVVQVREKDLQTGELLDLTARILAAVSPRALVTVNGRALVATALETGLHLPTALPVPASRVWPLWGRSVHSIEEAATAAAEKPDYLLLGTVFPTGSKPGHPGSGVSLIADVVRMVATIPILAIGGIDETNAASVIQAGAHGVAVRSAILAAHDPEDAARRLHRLVEEALHAESP